MEPASASAVPASRTAVALRLHGALPPLVVPDGTLVQQLIEPVVTAIPGCAPWFSGVTRHGGHAVPVFDLAAWRGLAHGAVSGSGVQFIELAGHRMALRADHPPQLLSLVEPPLPWPGVETFRHGTLDPASPVVFQPLLWLHAIAADVPAS